MLNKSIYINSLNTIIPDNNIFNQDLLSGNFKCNEPDYKEVFTVMTLRRMSFILKMAGASADKVLNDCKDDIQAIIYSTGYGCIKDTEKFLNLLFQRDEEGLAPTSFIYSTHNTPAGSLAIRKQNTAYNTTFVNGNLSFENALIDAFLLFEENPDNPVFVGTCDEMPKTVFEKIEKAGKIDINLEDGLFYGEGASSFILSTKMNSNSYCKIDFLETLTDDLTEDEFDNYFNTLLKNNKIKHDEIGLVLTGNSGLKERDILYKRLESAGFNNSTAFYNYKKISGEYPTSSAFAVWLASNIIKFNVIPDFMDKLIKPLNKILIYNNSNNFKHSFICLSKV